MEDFLPSKNNLVQPYPRDYPILMWTPASWGERIVENRETATFALP